MKRTTKMEVAKRWTRQLVADVEQILDKEKIENSDLARAVGLIDSGCRERIDLRGFPFRKTFHGKEVVAFDFTTCEWEAGVGGLRPVHAVDCNFANCKLDGALNKYFERCDFSHAKIIDCASTPGTRFCDCDFSFAMFRGGMLFGCSFENCSFASSKIRNVEFFDCVFDHCSFLDCDFKHASFGGSQFCNSRNNFIFDDDVSDGRVEKIIDPLYPMVDFKDSLMGPAKFT